MKKFGRCVVILFMLAFVPMTANADYINSVDVYEVGTSVTISWNHLYDGSAAPEASAFLTIVAEGVDFYDATLQENDLVYFNGYFLGELTQQTFYNPGFEINPGAGALGYPLTELTTSVFALNPSWLVVGLNLVEVVIDSGNWIMEVETSQLAVNSVPEPATMLLLGSGLLGLWGLRRKFRK